ncbi:NAD(P)H-dependent oxidoreductase [Amycolatopsis rhabdoformis]|uniref:NAD(P)H-dependent oxidoreductase n=1 Tax=Amycolatopsis rhabdoformis TaxID=1448059 RepID=A0ABZ1IDA3_9PSEU|nr:NAD(P)H-dependent oxidoreductase [Amycolatopsis rhabdoformis]WSE32446.1 NAD(P)H-dependent oxidoreductase [Amycolatopsis rhabdoformis]
MSDLTILALSGSLRKESLNTRLLTSVARLAPPELAFDLFTDLAAIPPFNEDDEHPAPAAVADLRRRIRAADGVLVATPEYNGAMPGVLKNALDWLSRPVEEGPVLERKPVAIIGASKGPLGTIRAQLNLRVVLHKMDVTVVGQPEFVLPHAHEALAEGELPAGSPSHSILTAVVEGLVDLIEHRRAVASLAR